MDPASLGSIVGREGEHIVVTNHSLRAYPIRIRFMTRVRAWVRVRASISLEISPYSPNGTIHSS